MKTIRLFAIAMLGVLAFTSCEELEELDRRVEEIYLNNLKDWVVNAATSEDAINKFGYEKCFTIVPLQDYYRDEYENYNREDTTTVIDMTDLVSVRSLVYCEASMGHLKTGEIVCNKRIANDLLAIFRALYEAKYNVDAMMPVATSNYQSLTDDANASNNYSFCFHFMGGGEAHEKGLAVVLNPYTPPTAGDLAVTLFKQHGFTWGGDSVNGKSYYFEKK